jgi:hypothetical protein
MAFKILIRRRLDANRPRPVNRIVGRLRDSGGNRMKKIALWIIPTLFFVAGAYSMLGLLIMKHLGLSLSTVVIVAASALGQRAAQDFGVPQLHTIKTVTLSPSYSCRSTADFQTGYANTALFLSTYSKQRNSPDLLFNGACKSNDDFQASTNGDAFSLISDLGANVSLEQISASRAFNLSRVHSYPEYSKFADTVQVVAKHTYAVLLNESDKRGLFVFTVDEYVPNQKVVLRYAVKSYQITPGSQIRSEGFDWTRLNN